MKIEGNPPNQAVEAYRRVDSHKQVKVEDATKPKQAQKVSGRASDLSDTISISEESKLFATAKAALDRLPDVREEKVRALSQLIQAGKYSPSAEKIAEKMLSDLLSIKV